MTEKLRANPFHCPHCAAKYALVKVEAPSPVDAKVRCISCGGPLDGRENAFILKYFLVERPRRDQQHTLTAKFPAGASVVFATIFQRFDPAQ